MSYYRSSRGQFLVKPIARGRTYSRGHQLRKLNLLDACLGPAEVNVDQNSVGTFGDKHLEEVGPTKLICTVPDPRQVRQSEDSAEVVDSFVKDLLGYERDD